MESLAKLKEAVKAYAFLNEPLVSSAAQHINTLVVNMEKELSEQQRELHEKMSEMIVKYGNSGDQMTLSYNGHDYTFSVKKEKSKQ